MKYCKNCNLKFDGFQNKCIFCNNHLEEINDEVSSSFSCKKPKSYYIEKIKKIILFCLIIAIVISIFLENYLFNDRHYWILVLFSSIYIYFVSSVSLDLSKGFVGKFMNISFLTSLETIGVFYFFNEFNMKGFVLSYIYPSIILISFIAIIIVYLINKGKKIHDHLIYIILNILWGLTPIISLLMGIVNPTYLSSITIAISSLIALGFIFFGDKEAKDEIIRRIHF